MSVHVPNHLTTAPPPSRIGVPRVLNQRYSPSRRRTRYSTSYGRRPVTDSIQKHRVGSRSSGCSVSSHRQPSSPTSATPVCSVHWVLK